MLRLVIGRAKSGKTALVMREIRRRALSGERGMKLIVPEQYSHEAERELCAVCGDSMSLHAEVLSFTRLSRRIADAVGGARRFLSGGGRALALSRALENVGSRLRVYGGASRSSELQQVLLAALAELKAACVTPERLAAEAGRDQGALFDKLADLSLILAAYDAVTARGELDPGDRLTALAESLEDHPEMHLGAFYIDGFTDFTAAERAVVEALSRRCADLTLCLTLDELTSENEIFALARRTAAWFRELARRRGEDAEIQTLRREADGPAAVLERHLFGYTEKTFDAADKVRLYRAASIQAECELAAARAMELVQSGARWRDIAVAVRGFDSYRTALEQAFEHYGVPLYVAARSDVMQKPLPLFLSAALDAVTGGFGYEELFACFKTGLAGLSARECDLLENYCILWSVRGGAWFRDFTAHPDGYDCAFDEDSTARLQALNALRDKIMTPFARLRESSRHGETVIQHARALADFFRDIELPQNLESRAEALAGAGEMILAAEYRQLWDIAVDALEQMVQVLPDTEMTFEEFGRLYKLMLAQSDVGSIPVSLDRVSAGEMDRMRRRSLRHLIVLGASDQRLPRVQEQGGVFSPAERLQLSALGLDLGAGAENDLEREMTLIYNCLTLPADTLTLCYCPVGEEGAAARPSFVMERAARLFDLEICPADLRACRSWSASPAFLLAAEGLHSDAALPAAALACFAEKGHLARLERLRAAAGAGRGRLSGESVRALYGKKLRLSASRVDKFRSCRFAFFMQYGLKARPRQAARFDPPQMGTFVHYVLEHVARDIAGGGSFHSVTRAQVDTLTDQYVESYVHERLNDFRDKTERFIYLFRRLTKTVRAVVWDMVEELSRSDFEPLDFELSFSGQGVEALPVGEDAVLTGVADRVDGWLHEGKLYLRVLDYKTGRKSFDLSDIWYGRDLQMLMYLFALAERGRARYGHEIVPAGVLYVPARDSMVRADGALTDEELAGERSRARRRSGLVLAQPEVLEAMEHGQETRYIPVTFKKGVPTGDALASAEELGRISRFIDDTLRALAAELKQGSIEADPYYRSARDNACLWCDYRDACFFDERRDCRSRVVRLKRDEVMALMAEKEAQHGEI
jgi:ATP-dependent helicase/nuclease subunit B